MISCGNPVRRFTALSTGRNEYPQTGDNVAKHQSGHDEYEEALEAQADLHELSYVLRNLALVLRERFSELEVV